MDNKIIPSFRDSVFTNALGDPSLDILEIGIDSIFENEILKSIPIAKIFFGIGKAVINLHDRNLLKQTFEFIKSLNSKEISEKKLNKYKNKISDISVAEKELGRVLILLNSFIDKEKSQILALLFRAYVNEDISWESFCEYSEVISRMFVSDFSLLIDIHKNKTTETKTNNRHQADRLSSLGLINRSMSTIRVINNNQITDYYLSTNHFGNVLCTIIING